MTATIEMTRSDADWLREEAIRFSWLMDEIKLGYITADNMTPETLHIVRKFTLDQDLVEGRDWCWATTAQGNFGMFSLQPAHRVWLDGATFHLWKRNFNDWSSFAREDYGDLGTYQEDAMDEAYADSYPGRYDGL